MSREYPYLSIVVPIRNEEQFISQTIEYLLNQDYPKTKMEILVVVADSEDGTEEVVKRLERDDPRVKYLHNPHGLSSGGRTLGAQMAVGEIIIFIDGHVHIDNRVLLKNTVELMEEKQVSILSRPQLLDTPSNSFLQKAISIARGSTLGHGRDSTIYSMQEAYVDPSSSGASYRREVFQRVGFFDTTFDACEDVEFNYRCAQAGFRSFTSPRLAVYYYPRKTISDLFRQMRRYGTGRFRLACKYPQTLSPSTLIPAMLITGPVIGIVAGCIWPTLLYPLLVFVSAYLLAVLLSSIAVSFKNGWRFLPVLPAVYFAIHAGLGWGFLRELFISGCKALRHHIPDPA